MNIVLIIYNRPGTTVDVFDAIEKVCPERLFIVADGPKNEKDSDACNRTRRIVAHVRWPCEVRRNYSEKNLGNRNRVASGLDWVFSQVEDAIILEDDCAPHTTFFPFCQELLERYRADERVWQISGDNHFPCRAPYPYSYYFSRYGYCWGWATWKRAWSHFDVDMKSWLEVKAAGRHHQLFPTKRESHHFEDLWDDVYNGRVNTWDYQWAFATIMNSGLCIVPKVNLVSNIGFGAESTHTGNAEHPLARQPVHAMQFPLIHPVRMVIDRAEENKVARRIFFDHECGVSGLMRKIRKKHFYGSLLRSTPVIGRAWARLRERRHGGNRATCGTPRA